MHLEILTYRLVGALINQSSTCLRRAIDSLGMISFRPRREIKHRAWYWFCPRSSSPRIRARKIFTSCKTFIMNRWADNSQRALKAVRIRQLFIYQYAFREYRQYSFHFCTVLNAVLFQTLENIWHGEFKDAQIRVCWKYRVVYCSYVCRPVLCCFCHALVIWTVKLKLGGLFLDKLIRVPHMPYKSENISPCCFTRNSREIAIGESSLKKTNTSCWQVCERSGAKPKAIKNFVRGHAMHDGKLLQRGQQSSRPVFVFIRHPPAPTSWLLLKEGPGPKHPSSAFHTPVWNKQAGGESPFSRLSLPEQEELWDRYRAQR